MRTLVLNAGYEPLAVVSFRRALVLVLAGTALLAVAARDLRRGAGWARSMLVVGQLMALAIGIPMAQGGSWVGWAIAASAVGPSLTASAT